MVLTIVTVLVLLFYAASRQRNDTREGIAYLIEADSTASVYRDVARQFSTRILGSLPIAQRENLDALMRQYSEDAQKASETLTTMRIPSSVAPAAAALNLAVAAWNTGLEEFPQGLFDVVDQQYDADGQPIDPTASQALEEALGQLRLGDTAYQTFLDVVAGMEEDLPVDFPEISFLPSGTYASTIEAEVGDAEGLKVRRDVEVSAVTLDPKESAVDDNGYRVLPATDAVVVEASIRNAGNETVDSVRVSVTLSHSDGALLEQATKDIGQLESRASTSVDFEPLPVTPGGTYTIIVTITALPGEVNTENNVKQIPIRINHAS